MKFIKLNYINIITFIPPAVFKNSLYLQMFDHNNHYRHAVIIITFSLWVILFFQINPRHLPQPQEEGEEALNEGTCGLVGDLVVPESLVQLQSV